MFIEVPFQGVGQGWGSLSSEVSYPGRLYSEVQCIMGNSHMGPPFSFEQTGLKTLLYPCSVGER